MDATPAVPLEPGVEHAISYIRFSSRKQREGDSERRQLEETEKYCERLGLRLVRDFNFQDLGVSAFTGANVKAKRGGKPALLRLMECCSDGPDGTPRIIPKGWHVVVEAFDRISRQDVWKSMTLLAQIRASGVVLHLRMTNIVVYPKGHPGQFNINDEDDFTFVRVAVEALQAHAFSKKLSTRMLSTFGAKRERARKGEDFISKSLPWWLTFKEGKIVSPPERRRIVKRIFEWTAAGWSSLKIARKLNADRVPTWRPQAKMWLDTRVRDLIRSDAALGVLTPTAKTRAEKEYSPGIEYRFEKYYPVIVTPELAMKARAAMRENTVAPKGRDFPPGRPQNLLRGLLRYKGEWCRFQSRPNGERGPDGKKTWNGYYDDHHPSVANHKTWSIAARQLEPVLIAGLLELKPADLVPLNLTKARRSVTLRKEITQLDRQVEHVTAVIVKLEGSDALEKKLKELEASLKEKRRELTGAEAQESAVSATHMEGFLKSLSSDLRDVKVREKTATALYRLIQRIDVADALADLPAPELIANLEPMNVQFDTRAVEDPCPVESKRRRMLALLVTFRGGGQRIIYRSDQPFIISARYHPSPLREERVQTYEELKKLSEQVEQYRLAKVGKKSSSPKSKRIAIGIPENGKEKYGH